MRKGALPRIWDAWLRLAYGDVGWAIPPPLGYLPERITGRRVSLRRKAGYWVRKTIWRAHVKIDAVLGADRRERWEASRRGVLNG